MTDTEAMTAVATLAQARMLHQQGRLAEAVPLYKDVLTREPRNSEALHLLGLAMATLGHRQVAWSLLAAAVQSEPNNPTILANLATLLGELGRHAEAISYYDRALAQQPDLARAHRGRGSALLQLGELQQALESLGQAVRLAPRDDESHDRLGLALDSANRKEEARQSFERAIALNPNNAQAHHHLGLLQASLGLHQKALASIERACVLRPNDVSALSNRGLQLMALGNAAAALESFGRALAIQPDDPIAHHNSGLALMSLNQHAQALASFERALQSAPKSAPTLLWRGKALLKLGRPADALASLDEVVTLAPSDFDVHFQRGMALTLLERYPQAIESFDKAISLNPLNPEAVNNRGAVLMRLFRPGDALQDFIRAVSLRPDYADAYINAGNALRGLGDPQQALRALDRALALKKDDPTATWSKALVKLSLGELREGWPLYEARLQLEPARRVPRRFERPRWRGDEPIDGKTLLVYADEGLGDTLQFCRYIPVLEAMGANVIFEVQPVLKQLLGSLEMRGRLLAREEPLPEFDLYTPLLSVPLALRIEMHTIARGAVPYLRADPGAVAAWRERLAQLPGLKVGINWHGNTEAERFSALQARSFPLSAAAALAAVPHVTLVSLQKGAGCEQRAQVEFGARLVQLTDPMRMGADELAAETAALMMGLDLVITADTALAHLAGALGVPVWVVLQSVPDWRWLIDRADSPWYPTMRLFRQRTAGDWPEVLERVATEVALLRPESLAPRPSIR